MPKGKGGLFCALKPSEDLHTHLHFKNGVRALGVDYGKKRTGLSVTDPLKMIVNPLTAIATDELDLFLINYLGREQVVIATQLYGQFMRRFTRLLTVR